MHILKTVAVALALAHLFPAAAAAQDKPILAVMEIEDKTGMFKRSELEAATEYLSTLLVASGKYSVVEKGRQEAKRKEVVKELKRESYDACYDEKCRIELGRALAADTLLVCSVGAMGKTCTLSCKMVPLDKEVADHAGVAEFDCAADEVPGTVKAVAAQLTPAIEPQAKPSGDEDKAPDVATVSVPVSVPDPIRGKAGVEWVYSKPAGVYFAVTETTAAQFWACVEAEVCLTEHYQANRDDKHCSAGHSDRDTHPMNCVDWYGAEGFCKWVGGRLPDEDEWFAEASDGGKRAFPWGDAKPTCALAVWSDGQESRACGRDGTWPVCSKPEGKSVSGLCDMAGNVWEWTSTAFMEGNGIKGGAWDSAGIGKTLRNEARQELGANRSTRLPTVGFRCVSDLE